MKENKSSLGSTLIKTLVKSPAGEAAIELAEAALDQGMVEGIVRDIPILGVLAKLNQAKRSVSDAIFLRKLTRFLKELNSVTVKDREKLLEKYPDGSEEQQVLGENLMLSLERLDNVKKPAILARFFAAYIREQIDYVTFTRLASSLERFNIELLPHLIWSYGHKEQYIGTTEDIIHELSLAGLFTASLAGAGALSGGAGFDQSELGRKFLTIGFGDEAPIN